MLSFLDSAFGVLRKYLSAGNLRNIIFAKLKSKKIQDDQQGFSIKEVNVEDFKVAYFPHKGIFYGKLFVKDHFYNEKNDSPFFKSNILHISLNEKTKDFMFNCFKYYNENGIPYIDSSDLSCSNRKLLADCIKLMSNMHLNVLYDIYKYGLDFMLMALRAYCKLKLYCSIVSHLKNLKVALVGYDVLFPCELSVALSLSGVKVCASQERLIQAFYPQTYLIFDYYFVASEVVMERGLKNSHIEKCIPVGLVRVDKLFEYEKKNIFDEKYDVIKKTRKIVLALDFHLPLNDIEDISRSAGKVVQARQFYNDLINLSIDFPSLYIIIKGKLIEPYRSHYIADIVERINSIDNIATELNLEKYDPYYISEKADLTIACHTSLADELLAAGRKVIFYKVSDYMELYFNYDNLPIIVGDYDGLRHHVKNYLKGIYLNEEIINKIKKKFYGNCYHGNVRKNIQSTLGQLIKTS